MAFSASPQTTRKFLKNLYSIFKINFSIKNQSFNRITQSQIIFTYIFHKMNVCSNFALSLTGSFHECRNCGREKKFHRLDFESNNIEYVQKPINNNNAAKFQQDKLQQIATQKQVEEDDLRAKACNNFVLALVGQFQQCGNCKIEKKYHKLDTAGQIAYQPKSQVTKPAEQTKSQTKITAVAEVVQETMMVQSVKDRIAQMNKKGSSTTEAPFRPSVKREEVQEKLPGQAEIVTEQVFTSVSDKKSVFDKQRVRKTIEQSTQQIREQQNSEGIRKAESQFITSSENTQEQQEQLIENQNENQENQQEEQEQDQKVESQEQHQQAEDDQAKEQPQQYQQEEEQQQQQEQGEYQQEQQDVQQQEEQVESNHQEQSNNENEQVEESQQQHLDEPQDVQEQQEANDIY
ncbi:unnamed protein product (macronuclear) [Paramecium tetraurelia]|uniref:Uncharacterized protein n=1 Tax=Paramecium tetraurelia TaxID=5888 RepID=A0BS18_PARTE|nr:uncharacterized protein GSPATT00031566001 [Paramecium tetraurelia]CAK61335.1 unnamed protein product [Paramecium tetraurelia]|eukprot:XP_001428733.1 hypothetical protein (macronuclear) [Paramecium tetraurelia strain d4-2]